MFEGYSVKYPAVIKFSHCLERYLDGVQNENLWLKRKRSNHLASPCFTRSLDTTSQGTWQKSIQPNKTACWEKGSCVPYVIGDQNTKIHLNKRTSPEHVAASISCIFVCTTLHHYFCVIMLMSHIFLYLMYFVCTIIFQGTLFHLASQGLCLPLLMWPDKNQYDQTKKPPFCKFAPMS